MTNIYSENNPISTKMGIPNFEPGPWTADQIRQYLVDAICYAFRGEVCRLEGAEAASGYYGMETGTFGSEAAAFADMIYDEFISPTDDIFINPTEK